MMQEIDTPPPGRVHDPRFHNAARRGMLADPTVESELVRLVSLYLTDTGEAVMP